MFKPNYAEQWFQHFFVFGFRRIRDNGNGSFLLNSSFLEILQDRRECDLCHRLSQATSHRNVLNIPADRNVFFIAASSRPQSIEMF